MIPNFHYRLNYCITRKKDFAREMLPRINSLHKEMLYIILFNITPYPINIVE